jgi:predicted RNA-binding Zn ribbon-like protein
MRPFAETGLVAIDLANTLDPWLDEQERLPDIGALRRFLLELGVDGEPEVADLSEVRALRATLREILGVRAEEALARARALVEPVATRVELVERDGVWALAPVALPGASLHDRLALQAVEELVAISRSPGLERLGRCAAEPCTDVFLDVTKNGSRQFCSQRCSNRTHARLHRARSRAG